MWVAPELCKNGRTIWTFWQRLHTWTSMSWLVVLLDLFDVVWHRSVCNLSFPISFLRSWDESSACFFAFRPKVGPVPAENLREILHHEIGFRDAGSPDPNSNCENCFFNQHFLSRRLLFWHFPPWHFRLACIFFTFFLLCFVHLFLPCLDSMVSAFLVFSVGLSAGTRRSTVRTGRVKNSARRTRCNAMTIRSAKKMQGRSEKFHDLEIFEAWSRMKKQEFIGNLNWVCLWPQEFTRFLVRQFAGLPKEDSVHPWLNCWHGKTEQVVRRDLFLKLSHLTHQVPRHFSNSGVDIEDVTSFKVCNPSGRYLPCRFRFLKWGRKGEAYTGSDTAVSWQHFDLARIGKMTVSSERFEISLSDIYLASISFRCMCLLLIALYRSLWLFHGRCSPASPKKWRGHPQWDPQVVEWLTA